MNTNGLHEVFVVGASRTPIGSFRGALASKTAPELEAVAIKDLLKKARASPNIVDEAIFGNVLSANIGQAPARQAALLAGLPESTICTTINKVCASGMKAVMLGCQSIALGNHATVVAGGMESMSNAPYYLEKARSGYGYGHQMVIDAVLKDGLWDSKYQIHMGECAEECATKFEITRQMQDAFAIQSYQRASAAAKSGAFKNEIAPVTIVTRKGDIIVDADEEPSKIDFDKVPKLKPAFRQSDGTVTAANSSSLNDGASAVLLMNQEAIAKHDMKPIARVLAYADAECNPKDFTIAPSLAIPKVLEKASLKPKDISLFELNEAFSVVILANQKILALDPTKVNVSGGAVALGHPIGSSGCRIIVTLLHLLKPGQLGCAAVCNGGGGASAMIFERL